MPVVCWAGPASAQQVKELTFWSHWAAEVPKRTFVEEAIKQFEAKNPGIKIKQTWYEKTALYAGLKTALRANQAPDIFYAEPDQAEYMENGFLLDLSELNWAAVEPWAKEAWTYQGKPYGLPLEAWTVELYYNKKTMADLGVSVPESLQLSPDAFLDMVKKAKAKSITPMALGVGDRPYPGAHVVHEALLKRLGVADYAKLLAGKLPWSDPRVVDTLKWVKGLTDAGLLPTTFTTLEAGRGARLFPHQSRRADVPERKLVHLARLQSRRQGRAARRTSRSASCSSRRCPGRCATSAGRSRSAAATSPMPRPSTPRRSRRSSTRSCRLRWATAGWTSSRCRRASRAIPRR